MLAHRQNAPSGKSHSRALTLLVCFCGCLMLERKDSPSHLTHSVVMDQHNFQFLVSRMWSWIRVLIVLTTLKQSIFQHSSVVKVLFSQFPCTTIYIYSVHCYSFRAVSNNWPFLYMHTPPTYTAMHKHFHQYNTLVDACPQAVVACHDWGGSLVCSQWLTAVLCAFTVLTMILENAVHVCWEPENQWEPTVWTHVKGFIRAT